MPAAGAERQNYIADRHVLNKSLNLPKFEIRKFSVEAKERLCICVLLRPKRNDWNWKKINSNNSFKQRQKVTGLLTWTATFNV